MRLNANLDTFIVIAILVAVITAIVAFAGPKLSEAANAIADIARADERAQARIESEKMLAAAQANAISAAAEISKTQALAAADVARTNAQRDLMSAQAALEKTKFDGQVQLARVAADAATAQRFIEGLVTAIGVIFSVLGLSFVVRTIHQAYRDRLQISAAREAIRQACANGGRVTLPNAHIIEINPPPQVPALPSGQAPSDAVRPSAIVGEENPNVVRAELRQMGGQAG